ncbi:TPA: hypothetical protein ACPVXB_001023 [Vibrio parahaemolyticus]
MKPDDPKDTGSSIDRKGQDNPKVVPFGKALVPAVRVFNNVHNTETERLIQVHSFGVGKIKGYEQIFIDGVRVFSNNVGINPNHWYSGNFNGSSNQFPNLSFGLRLGENMESPPFPDIIKWSDGQWTNDCRGDRVASISLQVYRKLNKNGDNNVRIMSDRFKLEALVHGNAVIDPRFDTNLEGSYDWLKRTWINSGKESYRNPACVVLTYLLDTYYGLGLPVDCVDVKSFIDLANHCDSQKLKFDGYIDQGADYGEILTTMCSAFDGVLYLEDGVVKAKADKASPSVANITLDDMVGTFKLSNGTDNSYHNIVSAEFVNADANFTRDKYVLPADVITDATIKADGFQKTKDVKLTYTVDSGDFNQVKKIANKELKKARAQRSIDFELDNTKKTVKIFDVISVFQPDFGLNGDKFRVTKIQTTLDDETAVSKITATEYLDSVYDESSYDDGITSPPIKPPTTGILSPTNLEFSQIGTTGGLGFGVLTWDNRHYLEHKVQVHFCKAGQAWKEAGSVSAESWRFEDLEAGTYNFRVRAVDVKGVTSDWVSIEGNQVLGGKSLPAITNLKGDFTGKDVVLSWDDMKGYELSATEVVGDAFSHYEVIISKGSSPAYASTHLVTSNSFTYLFSENTLTRASRFIKAEVFIVDKKGNRSIKGTVLNLTNTQAPQPSGFKVDGVLETLWFTWDDPRLEDYQATQVHISTSPSFTPSTSTLISTSTSNSYSLTGDYKGTYYARVGHYDVFGVDGISYSPAIQFSQQSIDDILDNSSSFEEVLGDLSEIDKDISGIQTELGNAIKDIVSNADSIENVNTTLGTHAAQISDNKTAITGVSGNLASHQQNVSTEFQGVKASIQSNATAIADDKKALSDYKTSVAAEFKGVKSSIDTNKTAIAEANKSIAALDTKLTSKINTDIGTVNSNLSTNYYTKTDTDGKITSSVSALKTELSSSISGVDGKVDSVSSNLSKNYYTKTQSDGKVSEAIAASESKLTAEIDKNKASISTLNKVTATTDGKVSAISQIKHDVNGKVSGVIMGNNGETSYFDVVADKFRVSSKAGDKAVFQVNSTTGETVIKDALIGNLSASKITSGTIGAKFINAIENVSAGTGNAVVKLSGTDANWRIAAGHSTMGSAPFRVDKTGKVFATNADIKGVIRATQLIFEPAATYPNEIKNSNITLSGLGGITPAGVDDKVKPAMDKANSASSAAGNAQTAANKAQSTANATADKIFTTQSPTQISSSDYSTTPTIPNRKGWGIHQDGTAVFEKIYAKGEIHATKGTFSNVTINENCTIRGTIYATNVIGDVMSGMTKEIPAWAGASNNKSGVVTVATFSIAKPYNNISRYVTINSFHWNMSASSQDNPRSIPESDLPTPYANSGVIGTVEIYLDGATTPAATFSQGLSSNGGQNLDSKSSTAFCPPFGVNVPYKTTATTITVKLRYSLTGAGYMYTNSISYPKQHISISLMPQSGIIS